MNYKCVVDYKCDCALITRLRATVEHLVNNYFVAFHCRASKLPIPNPSKTDANCQRDYR